MSESDINLVQHIKDLDESLRLSRAQLSDEKKAHQETMRLGLKMMDSNEASRKVLEAEKAQAFRGLEKAQQQLRKAESLLCESDDPRLGRQRPSYAQLSERLEKAEAAMTAIRLGYRECIKWLLLNGLPSTYTHTENAMRAVAEGYFSKMPSSRMNEKHDGASGQKS